MRKSYFGFMLPLAALLFISGCYKQEATRFYMKNSENVPQQNAAAPPQKPMQQQAGQGQRTEALPEQIQEQQQMQESGYQPGPAVPDSGGYIPHAVGSETGSAPAISGGAAPESGGVTPAASESQTGATARHKGPAAPKTTSPDKSKANTPK